MLDTMHKQVLVKGVLLDEEIAPLIKNLWQGGYITQFSCQGDSKYPAYILFPVESDINRFTSFLLNNNIRFTVWRRKEAFGGGASIRFSPNSINKINELIIKEILVGIS